MNKHGVDISFFLSFRVAVVLPAAQALITGFLAGYLVAMYGYFIHAPSPIASGFLAASVVAIVAWFAGLVWWRRKIAEYAPNSSPKKTDLWIVKEEGYTQIRSELPASSQQLQQVAELVHDGATLTNANLKEIFGGSRSAISAFQRAITKPSPDPAELPLGYWRNAGAHTQGIVLTDRGVRVFEELLAPSPKLEDKQWIPITRGNTRAHGNW